MSNARTENMYKNQVHKATYPPTLTYDVLDNDREESNRRIYKKAQPGRFEMKNQIEQIPLSVPNVQFYNEREALCAYLSRSSKG